MRKEKVKNVLRCVEVGHCTFVKNDMQNHVISSTIWDQEEYGLGVWEWRLESSRVLNKRAMSSEVVCA